MYHAVSRIVCYFMKNINCFLAQRFCSILTFLFFASAASAQTVQFFNESEGPSTVPISTFYLPPPWSSHSNNIGATPILSRAKIGVRVSNVASIQVIRRDCSDPANPPGTSFQIGSAGPSNVASDDNGIAHFDLTGRSMVTPFGHAGARVDL